MTKNDTLAIINVLASIVESKAIDYQGVTKEKMEHDIMAFLPKLQEKVECITQDLEQCKEALAFYQKPKSTNETTDLESGMPKLPGEEVEPEYDCDVNMLLDMLGIKPINPLWEHLKCNNHTQTREREEFAVWFDKSFYISHRGECQEFLAKLRSVALGRRSIKWEAFFRNDHLHLRRID
jgi:hypothetical protein